MKIVYIIVMVLVFPQFLLASEITGDMSTNYSIDRETTIISYDGVTEVKGAVFYADGVLLRCSGKIFVIESQMRRHIRSLLQLQLYPGQVIFEVQSVVINQYELKLFKDNDLIRGSDMRVYVARGKSIKHILNLEELRKMYFGREIFNIPDDIIENFVLVDNHI